MASFFKVNFSKGMSNNSKNTVDFIFIGMGAANCLILLKLHENGSLRDKKIAIIEPQKKDVNDRNFCFWSTEEELQDLHLEDLISSKWQHIKVANQTNQSIAPGYYYHVRGLDLYNKVHGIFHELDVVFFQENFNATPEVNSGTFILTLADTILDAQFVFDSRPPKYEAPQKNQSHLLQSFYGWEIKTINHCFDTSAMVMMDFEIPQNNYCQFMYILPFTENTALFEVTRFGKEKITKEEAEELLTEYIAELGISYAILEDEKGVIPMSSIPIQETNYGENWIATGANADLVKPTTGYAFHNMVNDAVRIADAINQKQSYTRKKPISRFKFYDTLLLKILEETPQHGKKIFQDLFHNIPIENVLTFLSEKSSLSKELHIFSKLPILIFLRVAFKNIFNRVSHISPVHLALITTIASLLLIKTGFSIVLWVFLGIGFLSVGLSHGALDYLTEKTIKSRKQFLHYILIYLAKGALLGLLWIAMPDLALLVFIAFSAWHFGQADFREWNLKQGLNSFIWGFIVLATILICHQTETVEVLNHIKGLQIQQAFESLTEPQLFIVQVSLTIFSIVFSFFLRSKKLLLTLSYLLLSSALPLLASFGIYFVAQHSMHGWRHLKADLQATSFNLWLKALPLSMGGALIFLIFMLLNNKDFFGIFFIVLSCMSLPHIISMHKFYRRDC